MNQFDFKDVLHEMECMILEHKLFPVELIIDPVFLYKAFPQENSIRIVRYRLPVTGEVVPIKLGRPGEFRLRPKRLSKRDRR